MPVDPITGAPLPYDDEMLEQEAMMGMMGDPMMGGMDDPMGGTVSVQVPEWAVPAVMEFVAMLEEEAGGMGVGVADPMAGGDPMGAPPMF